MDPESSKSSNQDTPIEFTSLSFDGLSMYFSGKAISQLHQYKQTGNRNEAGGFLFGEIRSGRVTIQLVSTPSKADKRSRFGFSWDKREANKTIQENFKNGLHYLGDWHTHPCSKPAPSFEDTQAIRSTFLESKHQLNYFIMLILGTTGIEQSYVALTDGKKEYRFNVK
ncbi:MULTISPECIES: Mov34/MPN/PAD-1 family protein [Vibrio]|uniref:Mov34/MPN/PAD-1 family protein n=1 Tax=Vibrio TaxID=662 RepID=UPI0004A4D9A4|nr:MULTISPECIES: Mov34/MPN/PAD-1 family protein [Vibrio]EHK7585907.1 Mov34/MPN/PAD-1 family protein [Vibrio parahaemolyticus]MCZ6313876.1 Mov34/MPN/PAD-1 family protein [Vibrio parahaemolyticus]MDW1660252.1 Mov34/MPN/PAD-1 family protein [Vibrio sp. Vb2658]